MKQTFTTFKIAKIFDVFPSTVADWIDSGELKGYTTPGGHRRVTRKALVSFMKKRGREIPSELEEKSVQQKILIVDDDPQIRDILNRSIGAAFPGTGIILASDGFEAGHEIASLRPDVVILDLMLPGIDGFRICSLIKGTYDHIKVIAITGYDTDEFRQRITEAGADAFMPKPLDLEEVNHAILKLLGVEKVESRG